MAPSADGAPNPVAELAPIAEGAPNAGVALAPIAEGAPNAGVELATPNDEVAPNAAVGREPSDDAVDIPKPPKPPLLFAGLPNVDGCPNVLVAPLNEKPVDPDEDCALENELLPNPLNPLDWPPKPKLLDAAVIWKPDPDAGLLFDAD